MDPAATVSATARPVMMKLLTAYLDSPCSQARAKLPKVRSAGLRFHQPARVCDSGGVEIIRALSAAPSHTTPRTVSDPYSRKVVHRLRPTAVIATSPPAAAAGRARI